jgi:hypothetical protein
MDDMQGLPDDTVHTGKAFRHCAHACGVPGGISGWSACHIYHTQTVSHLAQVEKWMSGDRYDREHIPVMFPDSWAIVDVEGP